MSEQENDGSGGISFSSVQLVAVIGAAVAAGGGFYGSFVGPQIERAAIQQCFDNSSTALAVVAQHGEEFVEVRTDIARVERLLYERTRERWTAAEQAKYERDVHQHEAVQNRRLDWLERQHVD